MQTFIALYWHENPAGRAGVIYVWSSADRRRPHGGGRIVGESLMYGRDNTGIGLRG